MRRGGEPGEEDSVTSAEAKTATKRQIVVGVDGHNLRWPLFGGRCARRG
jgi:hypothetical protein